MSTKSLASKAIQSFRVSWWTYGGTQATVNSPTIPIFSYYCFIVARKGGRDSNAISKYFFRWASLISLASSCEVASFGLAASSCREVASSEACSMSLCRMVKSRFSG